MMNKESKLFFEKTFNQSATSWKILPQSGSSRKNFIGEIEGKLYVITENDNILENEVFFYFSNIFSEEKLNTPKIIGISEDKKIYIQDFLGENTLSEIIAKEGLSPRVEKLVQQSLEQLFQLQKSTENKIDFTKAFEYETYDELPILHDLYYFKNFIVDVLELEYHKSTLLVEFKEITKKVEQLSPRGIMIRDFQSRNIMIDKENTFFIDYQGAMEGPLMYDVISFLFQAKANFPKEFKSKMLNHYISLFEDEQKKEDLKNSVEWLQLMRFLQVLGAYGFRGLIQRKPHFIASLEQGIQNISDFISNWEFSEKYPELKKVIQQLTTNQTQQKIKELISQIYSMLNIDIHSFSYKKGGIPKDNSGNGGGFAFDCRGILNPGRIEEYKQQTGKDVGVKEYLETKTEMPKFLELIKNLVSISIDDYLARGFENLQINFGCTGGQHRSVYSAEKIAEFIKEKYPQTSVTIHHDEQPQLNN